MRGFLGLTNYYRKFIKDFSKVAAPLSNLLTKENENLVWTPEFDLVLVRLNELLTSARVMAFRHFDLPLEVHTDVSNFAISGVLMQPGRPVANESKKLTGSQLRWSTHQKELFAVIHCLKTWKHYLGGTTKTSVFTDNITLKYLESKRVITSKELRWYDVLLSMNVELIHKFGRENLVPDALSRKEEHMSLNVLIFLPANAQVAGLSDFDRDILEAYKSDPTAQELIAMFDYRPIPCHGLSSKFRGLQKMMRNTLGFLF